MALREIELHTSERSCFRRCPQKWWWRFRMGLVPKGQTVDALWFGIGIHLALAQWYEKGKKRGRHPAETFSEWAAGEEREIRAQLPESGREWYDEPKFIDAQELGVAMLTEYVGFYGKDSHLFVIAIEQPFRINITYQGRIVAIFGSTFDGVVRDLTDGRIYLLEHKTAGQISLAYLELDDQAGAYWAVANAVLRAKKLIGPNEQISGILYNFLRKSLPDDRPADKDGNRLNKDGTVSKRQPADPFVRHIVERSPAEQRTQLERMADEVVVMNAMRAGEIPVYKNTTRDCTWCEFFTMCTLHERGGDSWRTVMRADFSQQDPYADNRKSA